MRKLRCRISFACFIRFILFAFSFFVFSHDVSADVVVYDDVSATHATIQLRALTKGRFFSEGGRLVEFYLEEKHIGTTLSGGDGYALLEYLPVSPGIKHLKVKSGDDIDEGVLLITGKKDKVILIESEGILFEFPYSLQPAKESKESMKKLSGKFKVVYVTSMIGVRELRKWLKDNAFPASAVLKWKGAGLLETLQEQGIEPYAVIGSPEVVSECKEHIKKRLSFEDTEDGNVVKNWKDVLKRL